MNTLSTFSWTIEKKSAVLQEYFESMVFAKAISEFKTGVKTIENPYMTEPTTTVATTITNLYSVATLTTTDESLTVSKESKGGTHIFNYEEVFGEYNLGAEYLSRIARKHAIDVDVDLAAILAAGAGNTITVAGGFTSSNLIASIADADQYLAGYDTAMNGTYLWIDASQMPAFTVTGALNGFTFADSILKNGFTGKDFMGHELYVSRGTLPADTAILGVKKMTTTGTGGNVHIEEKSVSGKFGMELASVIYFRSALWNNNEKMVVKYDLA